MYAVIFTAKVKNNDEEYLETALALRDKAISDYGCTNFEFYAQGDGEVAISHWPSKEQIQAWKSDPIHQAAQQRGRDHWYHSYRVQVVEILHDYSHDSAEAQ